MEGLVANVEAPANREFEVVFTSPPNSDRDTTHRVFIGPYGNFLGVRLGASQSASGAEPKLLEHDWDEAPIDAAACYLRAHGVSSDGLVGEVLEAPGFMKVWYAPDDEDVLGGWHTVFIDGSGELISIQKDQ